MFPTIEMHRQFSLKSIVLAVMYLSFCNFIFLYCISLCKINLLKMQSSIPETYVQLRKELNALEK